MFLTLFLLSHWFHGAIFHQPHFSLNLDTHIGKEHDPKKNSSESPGMNSCNVPYHHPLWKKSLYQSNSFIFQIKHGSPKGKQLTLGYIPMSSRTVPRSSDPENSAHFTTVWSPLHANSKNCNQAQLREWSKAGDERPRIPCQKESNTASQLV